MGHKLSFKGDQPKLKAERCRFCGSRDHPSGACPALTFCKRCGKKGHFESSCPEHTEQEEAKKARRDFEKTQLKKQLERTAKQRRTDGDWNHDCEQDDGFESENSEDCPFQQIDRPFTAEEIERQAQRREWFAEREERRALREQERKRMLEEHRAKTEALRGEREVVDDEEGDGQPPAKKQKKEEEPTEKLGATAQAKLRDARKDAIQRGLTRKMTKELKELLHSKRWQRKVAAQRAFFECPTWASLPSDKKLALEVRKDGKKVDRLKIEASLYYIFGRCDKTVDFPTEHPSISRNHLAVVNDGERNRVLVMDLGGRAGSFLDGKKLEPDEMVEWPKGGTLTLGQSSRQYILLRKCLWDED